MNSVANAGRTSWWRVLARALFWLVMLTTIGSIIGGQMGLLSGKRPQGLGFAAGKFKPCSWKPNCVNSTTDPKTDRPHFIEPLSFAGDAAKAWSHLSRVVKAAPRASVVREDAGYMQLEFSSSVMGFTDDVEFALDALNRNIHVRSASRLGVRDFGVNRARVEDIRARFGAALK